MEDASHQETPALKRLFDDADRSIARALKERSGGAMLEKASYSYGGKEIAVTCIGCEEAIAKAESARKRLESMVLESGDPMVKEGLLKLVDIARRDEMQARERSLMHHHFPLSLLEYDALMK